MSGVHADLSRDISRLLAGAREGLPIDAKREGAELAARYPDLRATSEMMEQAIIRAGAMVRIWLGEGPPPLWIADEEAGETPIELPLPPLPTPIQAEAAVEVPALVEKESQPEMRAPLPHTPSNIERVRSTYENQARAPAIEAPAFSLRNPAAAVRRLLFGSHG